MIHSSSARVILPQPSRRNTQPLSAARSRVIGFHFRDLRRHHHSIAGERLSVEWFEETAVRMPLTQRVNPDSHSRRRDRHSRRLRLVPGAARRHRAADCDRPDQELRRCRRGPAIQRRPGCVKAALECDASNEHPADHLNRKHEKATILEPLRTDDTAHEDSGHRRRGGPGEAAPYSLVHDHVPEGRWRRRSTE